MKVKFSEFFLSVFLLNLFALIVFTQEPQPTPPEEAIKIQTEEVHLNVSAQYDNGRFVPTLTKDDLLVVESGDPQIITSMQRVPANVLLLLDTGDELNFGKSTAATRIAAKIIVQNLSPEDKLAVTQYNDKIETIADWTSDFGAATAEMDKKLYVGKRSRFSEAILSAITAFKSRPLENRHLVMITDGAESVADSTELQKTFQTLLAANITIHVLSYTQIEESRAQKASRRIKIGDGKTQPRTPDYVIESLMQILPDGEKNNARAVLKAMNGSQRLITVTLDNEMLKSVRHARDRWRASETNLQTLADDSGGVFQAPESIETMWTFAVEVARAIDSQYVITYTPKNPISASTNGEKRKIRVSSHCGGVFIKSRQAVVVK